MATQLFKGAADSIIEILRLAFDPFPDKKPDTLPVFEYKSPGEISLSGNTVSLFLYSVTPNTFLRNTDPAVTSRSVSEVTTRGRDLLLDLSFMITAYAQTRETEFEMLEIMMQRLHDQPVIEGAFLTAPLSANDNEKIYIEPVSVGMDELNKLWSIFPQKDFKLSLFYMLPGVKMKSGRVDTAPVVTSVTG